MRGRDAVLLLILLSVPACFKGPDRKVMASLEVSKKCMDGGGTVDLTTGDCQCARGLPWEGDRCYAYTPRVSSLGSEDPSPTGHPVQEAVMPEEHKAVYAALPKDTVRPSEEKPSETKEPLAMSRTLRGPPRPDQEPTSQITGQDDSGPEVPQDEEDEVDIPPSPAPSSPAPSSPAPSSPAPSLPAPLSPPPPSPALVQPTKSTKGKAQGLETVCQVAGGRWSAGSGSCLCPQGKILSEGRCVLRQGSLSARDCRHATRPGEWRQGACFCKSGMVFAPSRGGCGVPLKKTRAPHLLAMRETCQGSANLGVWEVTQKRCLCPKGRLWLAEQCLPQESLTSRQICTSDFNQGRWNVQRKTCVCPAGSLWIDQQCESIKKISDQRACTSEFNSGSWSKNARTCQCPSGRSWSVAAKHCQ